MMASKKYLQGIETPSVFMLMRGSHDSKARIDTKSKVFVKRLVCKALFCYCDVPLRIP